MRLLIFNWKDTRHPAAGGAEVFTEEVAKELIQRGHEVTLFTSAFSGSRDHETRDGIAIVRRGGRLGVYRSARQYWSEASGSFDVVIDEINTRPFMASRWIQDTPVVALIHQLAREIWSYQTPFPISIVGRYVLEPCWLRAYRTVPAMTVSRSSAESLTRHHGWRAITVIPEGCEPHPVPAVAKEEIPTVVFLGRLVAMKRPDHALRAFDILVESVPDARLWIIGDGPLAERLVMSASRRVAFLGRVGTDELRNRLARAHVLVSTSVREGWGLNVSEAAACGTPAIAYAVPGLVDSVCASGGELVAPTPDALGQALRDFFSGAMKLTPQVSTVPWPEVAARVEDCLIAAIQNGERGHRNITP